MKMELKRLTMALLTACLLSNNLAAQTPPAAAKQSKSAPKKVEATPAPSAQEIADAKSKGLVWVNLGSGVFHKEGEFFGKTKRGKFMTEVDAVKP